MCEERRVRTVLAAIVWAGALTFFVDAADAFGPHGRGWGGHHYGGSYSGSSSYSGSNPYSYTNPYLNPYSYESQALPYWLKPGYRSGGGYTYSAPATRPDRFGAIAYSPSTGTYGYSYNYYSQAGAEQEALRRCNADDREIVGWMRNAYGALAVGDDVGQYGWSWGRTREEAERIALEWCRQRTTNCRIAVSVFSGN